MKDTQEFVDYLKEQGYKPFEIQYAFSLREYGETMTKAIYDFDLKYNEGEIDGFPDSSIEILEKHYGANRLKKMKLKTLYNKVYRLQRCLVEIPDEEHITDAVNHYLG